MKELDEIRVRGENMHHTPCFRGVAPNRVKYYAEFTDYVSFGFNKMTSQCSKLHFTTSPYTVGLNRTGHLYGREPRREARNARENET